VKGVEGTGGCIISETIGHILRGIKKEYENLRLTTQTTDVDLKTGPPEQKVLIVPQRPVCDIAV
jgi:hypothetical protein